MQSPWEPMKQIEPALSQFSIRLPPYNALVGAPIDQIELPVMCREFIRCRLQDNQIEPAAIEVVGSTIATVLLSGLVAIKR